MRVIHATAFGGPEVLELRETPAPSPGAGEALVAVAVAPVLFLDTQIRAGAARAWFDTAPPYVPGAGVAGTVAAVGEGVDGDWVGRRVVADTPDGGYADRALVPAGSLVAVPDEVTLDDAAALLHDGRTAVRLIEVTAPRAGEWALVLGAAGGLGALLVQLAAAAGARVVGAARGERKLALVRELGATEAVDYANPGWVEDVRARTGGVDVVLDGVGGALGAAAFELVRPGGRFSAHGAPAGGFAAVDREEAARRRVTVTGIEQVQFAPAEARRHTERALAAAAAGRLRPVVGQTFALADAASAHRALESRAAVGKTLLEAR